MFCASGSAAQADQDQVCTKLLDVFLIVDESGSIGATNYEKVRKFVSQFIESMPVGVDDVHIGLVTFSSNAVRRWALDDAKAQDPSLGSAAAMALPYAKGSTYTNKALDMVKNLLFDASKGARADVPKLVLVMTDGGSNSPSNTAASAAALRSLGAIIVVLGVGTGVNASECRNIAGCSNTTCPRYLQTDWAAVTEQVNSIILAACTDLAKDAICSEWTDYGPCKGPCGSQGLQTSTRVELSPPVPGTPPCPTCAEPQGRSCAEQPPGLERTIACVMPECKVDAQCGEFLPWSDWSATCGTATRKRVRDSYNIPPASGGGLTCLEQTPPQVESETQTVDKTPCPVQQQPGPWSDWSECSTTCGGGQQHRLREGLPQEGELYGGENLEAQGIAARETIICNENPCPVDATCGEWTPYGPCSKDCGGGTQVRRREPWLDNALHGGRTCMQQHPEGPTSMKECNSQPCPVDEVPGEWEDWQPCSEQCGLGEQLRHRGKSVQEAMYGGRTIREQNESLPDGEKILTVEIRECENHPCGTRLAIFPAFQMDLKLAQYTSGQTLFESRCQRSVPTAAKCRLKVLLLHQALQG